MMGDQTKIQFVQVFSKSHEVYDAESQMSAGLAVHVFPFKWSMLEILLETKARLPCKKPNVPYFDASTVIIVQLNVIFTQLRGKHNYNFFIWSLQ